MKPSVLLIRAVLISVLFIQAFSLAQNSIILSIDSVIASALIAGDTVSVDFFIQLQSGSNIYNDKLIIQ